MHDIAMHDRFVPQGCEHVVAPQPAVTLGAGTIWMQAYDAVTTQGGKYVQGGGCTTVGVAGLIQGGGFGSYSKRFGMAAASLLQAEVVTADGTIRIANVRTNPDLFWALKGGGGGSFGVVSKVTLQLHDLPDFFGAASFKIKAVSDDAYRRLVREFLNFYGEHLFNDHWGEQVHVNSDNTLEIAMVSQGLDTRQAGKVWQPFLDWVRRSPNNYSFESRVILASWPARRMWDVQWWKEHWPEMVFPNSNPVVGLFDNVLISMRLSRSSTSTIGRVLDPVMPGGSRTEDKLAGSSGGTSRCGCRRRFSRVTRRSASPQHYLRASRISSCLHCTSTKGPVRRTRWTKHRCREEYPMNPSVHSAFALAIVADGQGPAYTGNSLLTSPPSRTDGRRAKRIACAVDQLRAVTGWSVRERKSQLLR